MDATQLTIGGIAIVPVLIGWAQIFKKTGKLSGDQLTWFVLFSGTGAGILYQVTLSYPGIEPWVKFAVVGMAAGLAATGVWDLVQSMKPPVIEVAQAETVQVTNAAPVGLPKS